MFALVPSWGDVNPCQGPTLPERYNVGRRARLCGMLHRETPTARPPWATATAVLTATHHGFELATGVGLVLQPELGLGRFRGVLGPATAGVALVLASRRGGRGARSWAWSGAALRERWSLRAVARAAQPVRDPGLAEARAGRRRLSAYNTILYAWGATRRALDPWSTSPGGGGAGARGLATLPLQRFSRPPLTWLAGQAAEAPALVERAVRSA